jgi:uncharacterized protein (DUF1499 family)
MRRSAAFLSLALLLPVIQPDLSCPETPNCVSTEVAREGQRMEAVPFSDAPEAAQARARAALLAEARTRIVTESPGLLEAEATSLVFRFVDDVRIVIDAEARVLRFRSASRVGRSDLGVNRRRMTRITERLRDTAPR